MFPFIATLAQVGGILVDKIILTRRQVSVHVFVPILFLFLFLFTALLFPFFGNISIEIFKPLYIALFAAMLVTAVIWNIFYYQGVQSEKVHKFEIIVMLQPLLTIFLAAVFLKSEKNIHTVIAATLAAVFLIIAHLNKKHLEISEGAGKLILAVIFMSIELIIIKLLLDVFSPVALYFARTGFLLIFFLIFYHPQIKKVSNQNIFLIALSSFLGTTQMVSKFYGFQEFGVVYTSLILIISPILIYICSMIFLHEKLKLKTIFSAIVILGCIIYATTVAK